MKKLIFLFVLLNLTIQYSYSQKINYIRTGSKHTCTNQGCNNQRQFTFINIVSAENINAEDAIILSGLYFKSDNLTDLIHDKTFKVCNNLNFRKCTVSKVSEKSKTFSQEFLPSDVTKLKRYPDYWQEVKNIIDFPNLYGRGFVVNDEKLMQGIKERYSAEMKARNAKIEEEKRKIEEKQNELKKKQEAENKKKQEEFENYLTEIKTKQLSDSENDLIGNWVFNGDKLVSIKKKNLHNDRWNNISKYDKYFFDLNLVGNREFLFKIALNRYDIQYDRSTGTKTIGSLYRKQLISYHGYWYKENGNLMLVITKYDNISGNMMEEEVSHFINDFSNVFDKIEVKKIKKSKFVGVIWGMEIKAKKQ